MGFLAPLMLSGLLGVAVPIAIHLIGRRNAPRKKFGAIDFLLGNNERTARRLRLRELVLLALRAAACAVIPLALAKPFFACQAQGPTVSAGPQAVVIVIDNSLSMGARLSGETLLAIAKDRALTALGQLGSEADVAILTTAESSPAATPLSRDHQKLRDRIDDIALVLSRGDLAAALRSAEALLTPSSQREKRILVFSALRQSSGSEASTPSVNLQIEDVSDGTPIPNIAVTRALAEHDSDRGPNALRVLAEVTSYASTAASGVTLSVRADGRVLARGTVNLSPGEPQNKVFSVTLPSAVVAELSVDVEDSVLPEDNRRFVLAPRAKQVHVLVANGDPRTIKHDDEAFYLLAALHPDDRASRDVSVDVATTDEVARRRLDDYQVIFLCNAKAEDVPPALEAWVEKGGGLFVSVGDRVDADEYDGSLSWLLPQELRPAREVAPNRLRERSDRIARVDGGHALFRGLDAQGGLGEGRFWKVALVAPSSETQARRVLAWFESGAPALIEAQRGTGRVWLWASTIDRDWNDLAIHPGFLPFIQKAVRVLAGSRLGEGSTDTIVGQNRQLAILPTDQRLEVRLPNGDRRAFYDLKDRATVSFADTSEPGLYRVEANGTRRAEDDFVVNIDPKASDTRPIAKDQQPQAHAMQAAGLAVKPKRKVELWHGLAVALLLFMLGESLLVQKG